MYKNRDVRTYKNSKGITLIAVVVTVVVLLILLGISSEILIGKNGIITKAEKSREDQKIVELTEKLELIKAPAQVDKLDTVITVDDYLEELQQPNAVDFSIDEIVRVDEENAYVTVSGDYVFLIEYKEDKTLIITYQGKIEELKPQITKIELSNTTNSITVKAEANRVEKYKFYIKDTVDGEYEYKAENESGEYTYSNLIQNKEYYIKVEVINKRGQVESEIKRTTGEMPVLTEGELISTITPTGWANTNKTTKIEIKTDKDVSEVKLQYTKLPESATTEDYKNAQWTNYTSSGIISEKNETIAIRLWDGINETSRMAVSVDKIDKTKPVDATITISGTTTQTTLPVTLSATVTHTDKESGIAITSCKYVINTSSSEIGTTASSYTGGTFSSNGENITISLNAVGSWYLHVLSVDNAGNAKETIKGPITIAANSHTHVSGCTKKCTYNVSYVSTTYTGNTWCSHTNQEVLSVVVRYKESGHSCGTTDRERTTSGCQCHTGETTGSFTHTYYGCGYSNNQILGYTITYP